MMRTSIILSRYFARHYLGWFSSVFATVTLIITLFDLMELLRRASGRTDIGAPAILEMLLLKLPSLLQQLLPFIVFFSVILTLWTLNRRNELTVSRAMGISIWQILAPLVTTSLVIGCIDVALINPLSAKLMLRYEHLNDQYFQGNMGSLSVSETGLWVGEADTNARRIYHIKHVNPGLNKLTDVTLYMYDHQDHLKTRINATSGLVQDGYLHLSRVWSVTPDGLPSYLPQLALASTLTLDTIQNSGASPRSVSFWDLRDFVKILEKSGISGHKYLLHWHSLLAHWAWLGVMVLLATACAVRPIRQGGTLTLMVIGAVIAFGLYILQDITYALGASGTLPILLAAWTPTGISALLGISVLLYSEDG